MRIGNADGGSGAGGRASRRAARWALAWLAVTAVCAAATGGSISGTVADASGAVMRNVAVTAVNEDTGTKQRAVSNEEGFYAFPVLASGRYKLKVEESGFQRYEMNGVEVTSNAAVRIDIQLALGTRSETISVVEAPAAVETASIQMGELIQGWKTTAIPVNGRSYTDLLALQPGVAPVSAKQPNAVVMSGCATAPPSGDLNPGDLPVGGQRETANGFMVNGSPVQEDFNLFAAVVPNLDSILEFRVLTSNFDAEYGNFSGGQVMVTTRGGANELHGGVFDFVRNTRLAARNFFAPERAAFDRNQFGGTPGGRLRKDRAFFFADYQGTRMTRGMDTGLIRVPSLKNREGDLSDTADRLTGTVNGQYWAGRLTARLGYGVRVGEPYYFPGCTDPAQCVLPNARIPKRAWSVPAANLISYLPQPNRGAHTFSSAQEKQTLRDDKAAIKMDVNTRWGAVSAYRRTRPTTAHLSSRGRRRVRTLRTRGPFSAEFAGFTDQKTIGNSNYNSLQASLRHAGEHGEFLVGYTYGKSLDQSSSLSEAVNPLNHRLSRALPAFDPRQNLVASYQARLPLERLFRKRSGWTGGWRVSGLTRLSTGLPVTLFNNGDTSLLGTIPNGINSDGVDTPDYRPGDLQVNHDPRGGQAAFNHAQFFGAAAVNGNIQSGSFGQVLGAMAPRTVQVAAKFQF